MSVLKLVSRGTTRFGEESRSKLISALEAESKFSNSSYLLDLISRSEDPLKWSETFSTWFIDAKDGSDEIISFLVLSELVGFHFQILSQYIGAFQKACNSYRKTLSRYYEHDPFNVVASGNEYDEALYQLLETGAVEYERIGQYIITYHTVYSYAAAKLILGFLLNTPFPSWGIVDGSMVNNTVGAKNAALLVFVALNTMRNAPDYSIRVGQYVGDNYAIHVQSNAKPNVMGLDRHGKEVPIREKHGTVSVAYTSKFIVFYNGYQMMVGGAKNVVYENDMTIKKTLVNGWEALATDSIFASMYDYDGKNVITNMGI